MAEAPRDPETGDDAGTPRWLYVVGTIVIVLALLFVVMHLTSGGFVGHQ